MTQCSSEQFVNAFLITDGILSVFVFPITIMDWTKRIGGCVKKEAIEGHGISFITVVFLRFGAAVVGELSHISYNEYSKIHVSVRGYIGYFEDTGINHFGVTWNILRYKPV